MKFFIVSIFFCLSASASECPWLQFKGSEMMAFDSAYSVDKSLTQDEVEADLKCLKILFKNYYIAQKIYGDDKLILRLNQEITSNKSSSSRELMARIFSIHADMTDIHLAYTLGDEGKRFQVVEKKEVKLSEELSHDTVYQKGNAFYFRPGSLINSSLQQQAFIELVRKTDKDLIVDLRGNGGGDDQFAYDLAEAIFTKDQKIPITKRYQVHSPLQRIGFSVSLFMHGHNAAESYRKAVRNEVEALPFQSLLPYQITEEVKRLEGKRANPYRSRITLIIDGKCASSCETIVEKISMHPKARVIGQNTLGAIHFSNVETFILPHSGIIVQLPTLLQVYENDALEGIGYRPNKVMSYVELSSLHD